MDNFHGTKSTAVFQEKELCPTNLTPVSEPVFNVLSDGTVPTILLPMAAYITITLLVEVVQSANQSSPL